MTMFVDIALIAFSQVLTAKIPFVKSRIQLSNYSPLHLLQSMGIDFSRFNCSRLSAASRIFALVSSDKRFPLLQSSLPYLGLSLPAYLPLRLLLIYCLVSSEWSCPYKGLFLPR